MFRKDRKKGGGGLMAFISTNVEVLPIEIKTTCSTILLFGVYRPPKAVRMIIFLSLKTNLAHYACGLNFKNKQ